jgi:hypothetical protein
VLLWLSVMVMLSCGVYDVDVRQGCVGWCCVRVGIQDGRGDAWFVDDMLCGQPVGVNVGVVCVDDAFILCCFPL